MSTISSVRRLTRILGSSGCCLFCLFLLGYGTVPGLVVAIVDSLAAMRTNLALEIFLLELAAEKSVSWNGRSDSDCEDEEPLSEISARDRR